MNHNNRPKSVLTTILLMLLILSLTVPSLAETSTMTLSPTEELIASKAVKIARVTGPTLEGETIPNPSQTHTNYALRATDLGVIWDATTDPDDKKVMIAFGDSYDDGWGGFGGGGTGWRGNLLAISKDTDVSDGILFSTMIADPATPNYAKEIIHSDHITNGSGDFTAIPTAGITVGARHYIHYMQIKNWGAAGRWNTNFSEIAYSDDEGQNWTKSGVKWGATSKFGQAAYLKEDGYVYMFGTPVGRFDAAYLARVAEADMLDFEQYEYWNGTGWVLNNEAAAVPIVEQPVSELSVVYNSYYNKYMMTYLNENRYAIVMRSSSSLTGGWSAETEIATGAEYPGLYGAFIHPWTNDGRDLYFLMSEWGPYNVVLMKSKLDVGTPAKNLIADPSFENQTTGSIAAPWVLESGNGGIDRNLGLARGGKNNVWMRNNVGWNAITQSVPVIPNTEYRLTGFLKSSQNLNDGYFGARGSAGKILAEVKYGRNDSYTKQTVKFNSGANTSVTVFSGYWTNGDTWVQMDDFMLLAVDATAPVVTLNGEQTVQVNLDDSFTDLGATAIDNLDGDLTHKIVKEGTVDTSVVGTYTLTYKVTDAEGNTSNPVTRTIVVTGPEYSINNVIFTDGSLNLLEQLPQKGMVIATAELRSNTSSTTPVTLVLVLYNKKGGVENVAGISQSITSGATETVTAGFMLPGNSSGYTAKLFVADSIAGLQPISNVSILVQ